jgi:hypothetical protein
MITEMGAFGLQKERESFSDTFSDTFSHKTRLRDFLRTYLRLKRDALASYREIYDTKDLTRREIEKRAFELLALDESQAFLLRVEKDALMRHRVDDDELLSKARELLDDFEDSENPTVRCKLLDQVCKMTAFYSRAEERSQAALMKDERQVRVIVPKNSRFKLSATKGVTIEEEDDTIAEDEDSS